MCVNQGTSTGSSTEDLEVSQGQKGNLVAFCSGLQRAIYLGVCIWPLRLGLWPRCQWELLRAPSWTESSAGRAISGPQTYLAMSTGIANLRDLGLRASFEALLKDTMVITSWMRTFSEPSQWSEPTGGMVQPLLSRKCPCAVQSP